MSCNAWQHCNTVPYRPFNLAATIFMKISVDLWLHLWHIVKPRVILKSKSRVRWKLTWVRVRVRVCAFIQKKRKRRGVPFSSATILINSERYLNFCFPHGRMFRAIWDIRLLFFWHLGDRNRIICNRNDNTVLLPSRPIKLCSGKRSMYSSSPGMFCSSLCHGPIHYSKR